mmetsp:Transcript_35032/g.36437  ORF Transcript_35032/g.36437 Transcript_35032/m.36437 type:complete len:297 (-) Transcript_35032:48-938(-)
MIDLLDHIGAIATKKRIKPPPLQKENTVIEEKEFREFVVRINFAQKYLRSFSGALLQIRKIRRNMQKSSNTQEVDNLKNEASTRIHSCREIQKEIKEIIVANEGFVNDCRGEEKYYSRIVSNLYSACLKQFEKTTEKFTKEQDSVRDYIKSSILRDAEMVLEKKLSDNEKEDILNNPELVQDLLKSKLEGQAHETMVNKVNDLAARHQDILRLEKSVNEVYQLFVDLQELVRNQGEIIDNIEANISTAKDCVLDGEVNIAQSYDYLKSARKKKCIVIIIVVVIMCILIGTIAPMTL